MASKSESKSEFTFKNFFKYWFNHWLLVVILMVIGAVGGIYYTSTRPLTYTATSRILVYNPNMEQGSSASPYAQIKDLLINEKLVGEIDENGCEEGFGESYDIVPDLSQMSYEDRHIYLENMRGHIL